MQPLASRRMSTSASSSTAHETAARHPDYAVMAAGQFAVATADARTPRLSRRPLRPIDQCSGTHRGFDGGLRRCHLERIQRRPQANTTGGFSSVVSLRFVAIPRPDPGCDAATPAEPLSPYSIRPHLRTPPGSAEGRRPRLRASVRAPGHDIPAVGLERDRAVIGKQRQTPLGHDRFSCGESPAPPRVASSEVTHNRNCDAHRRSRR